MCPPREAGCSLTQTWSNRTAAESSCSSQSRARGWHKRAERVTLSVSSRAVAGMRSLCRFGQRVLRSPGWRRRGGGGSGRFSVAGVVFVEGKCSVHNVVVGNRLRLEVCAAERGVGRLCACLPPSWHGACRTLGCCLCWAHPYSSVPARDPLGHTCHHPV